MLKNLFQKTQTIFQSAGTIIVNGKEYKGSSVITDNTGTYIDGIKVEGLETAVKVEITVKGDVQSVTTVSSDVVVNGNASSVRTTSGDVLVKGDVGGHVNTVSGDVVASKITGNTNTVSGDISTR